MLYSHDPSCSSILHCVRYSVLEHRLCSIAMIPHALVYCTVKLLCDYVCNSSYRIRNTWEIDFIAAKSKADKQAPPNSNVAPPTSPVPVLVPNHLSSELKFLHPLLLQSGRVGTEVRAGFKISTEVFVVSKCITVCVCVFVCVCVCGGGSLYCLPIIK